MDVCGFALGAESVIG